MDIFEYEEIIVGMKRKGWQASRIKRETRIYKIQMISGRKKGLTKPELMHYNKDDNQTTYTPSRFRIG